MPSALVACRGSVAALSCGLLLAGCPAPSAESAGARSGAVGSPPPAAARWVFHPKGPQQVSGRAPFDEGELVVDRGGSRWLVRADAAPEPAAYGAPEALVGARRAEGHFAFVGESGSVYVAEEALGPFVSVRKPPESSFGAVVHAETVLAVGQTGRLWRSSDLGRSWRAVPIAGFVSAVALDAEGRGLVMSAPEQWFWSTDRGVSFRPIAAKTIAPERLEGGRARIRAVGPLGSHDFDGTTFVPAPAQEETKEATWALPPGPTAALVRSGHGVLGDDFTALVPSPGGPLLLRGKLGRALSTASTTGLSDCARYRVAVAGRRIAVLCAKKAEGGMAVPLSLRTADVDRGQFQAEPVVLWGDFDRTRFALSAGGYVGLHGVCSAEERDPGCSPRGLHAVRLGKSELVPLILAVPDPIQALAFGADEELYAAAVREKDGHVLLSIVQPDRKELGRTLDLAAELELGQHATAVELLPSQSAFMGVLVVFGEEALVVSSYEGGRLVTSGRVPPAASVVHGAGLHLAALSSARRLLFESADGGVTWAETALPRAVCPGDRSDCTPPLVCGDAGCLIGDELTRVGWGTLAATTSVAGAPPSPAKALEAHFGEYSCQVDAERPLELPNLVEVPGAAEAALGDVDFSAVLFDAGIVALDFAWVARGERRLSRVAGFAAVSQPERYAVAIVPQVEGAAALRFRVPVRQTGDRMLSEIEVAWNNRISRVAAHQRFSPLIEAKQGDYHTSASGPGEALPQLLSVAGPGVYLALHRAGSGEQATYYFKSDGYELLPAPRLPQALGDPGDTEYVRLGGEHVPLAFAQDRSRAFLGGWSAHPDGGVALLLGDVPASLGRAQGMRLSYRGDRIGSVSMMVDVDGRYWAARFAEFGGANGEVLGEVVRAPLKPDLGAEPRACSDAERETTPRIVAPEFPGPSPRLRVVRASGEVGRFKLSSAVLHGTPETACLAAWAGEPEASGPSASGVLLLPTDKGLFGWYFSAKGEARSPEGYDAWPLSCTLAE